MKCTSFHYFTAQGSFYL